MRGGYININPRVIILTALCLLCCSLGAKETAKKKKKQDDKKIYLVHADRLSYDRSMTYGPEAMNGQAPQIVKGHVHFTHKGATLYSDSAYFYEAFNSFKAFGHVKLLQGDTLSLTSDYAFYDGDQLMAEARYNVVLKHRGQTLYTDSLNYDRLYGIGYFFEGGKLIDKKNVLTSDWGEYHTDTREAVFNYDVTLINKEKNFTLTTDTLYYDTRLSIARIVSPANIVSGKNHIYTERGYYDTALDRARLMNRSMLTNEGKSMTGDSIYNDNMSGFSEIFGNVIYIDTLNKQKMTGNYAVNNDATGYSMTTDSALVMDFSEPDTMYIHADTFKVFTFYQNTDSAYREMHAFNKVRTYKLHNQFVCDSMVYNSRDSSITLYRDPIAWNDNQQLTGEEMRVYLNDSTIEWAHVIGQAFSAEQHRDSVHYNQVSSKEMKAFFKDGDPVYAEAISNVLVDYFPVDEKDSMLTMLIYIESDTLRMFLKDKKLEHMWMPKSEGMCYPMTQIPPDRLTLPGFNWFSYIRPTDPLDVFHWRGKPKGQEIKPMPRRVAPRQKITTSADKTIETEDTQGVTPTAETETEDAKAEITDNP